MKEKKCNYTTGIYQPGDYNYNCENLLPCGVCRLTGQMCPKHWNTNPYSDRIIYFTNKVEVK